MGWLCYVRLRRDVHAVLATPPSSSSTPTPCLTKCRARFIIIIVVNANALLSAISRLWKRKRAACLEALSQTFLSRNLARNSESRPPPDDRLYGLARAIANWEIILARSRSLARWHQRLFAVGTRRVMGALSRPSPTAPLPPPPSSQKWAVKFDLPICPEAAAHANTCPIYTILCFGADYVKLW